MSSQVAQVATATRAVLARGRSSLSVEFVDARDRLIASDPGLFRLRRGLSGTLAVGTTALVEEFEVRLVGLTGKTALLPVMLGAMLAMTVSTSVREASRAATAKVCAWVPVAVASGLVTATFADRWRPALLTFFVVMTFLAVWVRQFGPRWSTWGFLAWQAYFFAIFLDPPLRLLPQLLAGVVVSAVWVAFLLLTLLHDAPAARLRRIVFALRARVRAAISACLDLLEDPDSPQAERMLRRQLVKASAVALLLEAQIGQSRSLPAGVPRSRLRRWLIDLEIGLEEVAGATVDLISPPPDPASGDAGAVVSPVAGGHLGPVLPTSGVVRTEDVIDPDVARLVRSALRCLGWGHYDDARAAISRLPSEPAAVRRLAKAAQQVLEASDEWTSGRLLLPRERSGVDAPDDDDDDEESDDRPGADPAAGGRGASEPGVGAPGASTPGAHVLSSDETGEFEPVMRLVGDNLPGSQALAKRAVGAAPTPWWQDGHLSFATRQAIQAAVAAGVAVGVGDLISPRKFYWAAIAAFLTFIGASTTAETARKAVQRTLGTMLGLVFSLVVGVLTSHSLAVTIVILLASVFFAYYFQPLSYAVMIFFITVYLGELYELLHTYTDTVMLLRLAETAVGAAAGIAATFLVLPVPARATAKIARQQLMDTMAELLEECSDLLWGVRPDADVPTTMVRVSDAARLMDSTRTALLRPRVAGVQSPGQQHLTHVLAESATAARAVAQAVLANPGVISPAAAAACRALADECRRLAGLDSLLSQPRQPNSVPSPADQVMPFLGGAGDRTPVALARRIRRLAESLTLLTPRGRIG